MVLLRKGKVLLCICICLLFLTGVSPFSVFCEETEEDIAITTTKKDDGYYRYLDRYSKAEKPRTEEAIYRAGGQYNGIAPAGGYEVLSNFQGKNSALLLQSGIQYTEYVLTVKQAGMYSIEIEHYPMDTNTSRYDFSLQINGEIPFYQAAGLHLYNTYCPQSTAPVLDSKGNQFASNRKVFTGWTRDSLKDPDGDYDLPLQFYLIEGENVIRFVWQQPGAVVIGGIRIKPVEQPCSYQEYRGQAGQATGGNVLKQVEAEDAVLQSDSTLRPSADLSDPITYPHNSNRMTLNMIDSSWGAHGQWLEWVVDVPKTGDYQLSFRYRQNTLKALPAGRKLTIQGEIPFKDASYIKFPYASGWNFMTLKDENESPYLFRLEKGKNTIRLEAVLGDLEPIIQELDEIIYNLNDLYRKIIMITSTSPDKYRDYNVDKEIPDLLSSFEDCSRSLKDCYEKILAMTGGNSADCAILMTTVRQLEGFLKSPQTIPFRLTSFQSNIGSISSWIYDIRLQPLALDYFTFWQKNAKLPKHTANFLDKIGHELVMLFKSFFDDYSNLETRGNKSSLTIWLGSGKDQAEILWKMSNDLFTPKTGIGLNVKLVSATMVEAFLSGQAPDVAIQTTRDTPVNLAVRSALLDLSTFNGFSDVKSWFSPAALTPYTFQNSVYGLPDSQTFNMMFYRKDILNELDLPVPQTWDEFVKVGNQLHLYKLDAGVPSSGDSTIYYTLLMQKGGVLFNSKLTSVQLDLPVSIDAFTEWTDFYKKVGLPLSYDFFNRFRSGEMPLAIAPYTLYNQLESAAPELRNLWGMVHIPGTLSKDGKTIDRTAAATGTAAVILCKTKHPDDAWEFIKWWTGSEAQTRYGNDVVSRMGTIARIAPANVDALTNQGWTQKQLKLILEQQNAVQEIPQVPGNYYLDRDLTNMFRSVVYNNIPPKDAIVQYEKRINDEIRRKLEEFGIE